MLLLLDNFVVVSLQNVFLVKELKISLIIGYSWKMTSESLVSSPFGSHAFSCLTLRGEIALPWVSVEKVRFFPELHRMNCMW